MHNISCDLILLSAGQGKRLGGQNKGLLKIGDKTFIEQEIDVFLKIIEPSKIAITYSPEKSEEIRLALKSHHLFDKMIFVKGGRERVYSVFNALKALRDSRSDLVAIHDAARPLISPGLIEEGIGVAIKYGSAIPAVPLTDTIKLVKENRILMTLPREDIYCIQTPQFFHKDLITFAYNRWFKSKDKFLPTDDASLLEYIGISPRVYQGERGNIKITFKEDIKMIHNYPSLRIGFGYDIHRIKKGGRLYLGGVCIEEGRSAIAHSDGDVLLHAICDALLGAAGLRDIGYHFPDSDERYKGISSLTLLEKTYEIISAKGFSVLNIDSTVILEKPKIAKFIDTMKKNISKILFISESDVSIKATTPEKIGEEGKRKAFSAYCTALISTYTSRE